MPKVDAVWIGGNANLLVDETTIVLVPGETVASVNEDEARDSDNWRPVQKPKKGSDA